MNTMKEQEKLISGKVSIAEKFDNSFSSKKIESSA